MRNRNRRRKGKMIPVWNFLGSVSVEIFLEEISRKRAHSQPDLSLMTINTMDGSVMERRIWGSKRNSSGRGCLTVKNERNGMWFWTDRLRVILSKGIIRIQGEGQKSWEVSLFSLKEKGRR